MRIRLLMSAAFAVVILLLAVLPFADVPRSWQLYAFLFFIYLAMSNMWNLLAGYSGLVSLCQPAFLGIAGYTMVILSWVSVPWWLGLWIGGLLAAVFAAVLSNAVFRLTGIYFSIGTLVVPEALRMVFFLWRPVGGALNGGGSGYMLKGTAALTTTEIYWIALFVAVLSVIVMRVALHSNLGLGLAAIRDNQRSAAASGVNVFRMKLYTFVVSGAITGLAGAAFYLNQGYIEPTSTFTAKWTMMILLAAVIGGIGSEEGPFYGSIVTVLFYFLLARYSGYSLLIEGVILIAIMLVSPQGIVGMLRKMRWYRSLSGYKIA